MHLGNKLPHGRGVDDENGVTDTKLQDEVESERDASTFKLSYSNGLWITGWTERIGVESLRFEFK
jgi:hypothetical protein